MNRVMVIDRAHELYAQAIELRSRVLLEPIGLTFDRYLAEFPGLEDRFEHIISVIDHPSGPRVVGTASLLPAADEPATGRLTQMAVDEQRRREGVGRLLVVEIEKRAVTTHGLERLVCHAQLPAIQFYESLGWTICSDEFIEAGIPHRKMEIQLHARVDEPSLAATPEGADDDDDSIGI